MFLSPIVGLSDRHSGGRLINLPPSKTGAKTSIVNDPLGIAALLAPQKYGFRVVGKESGRKNLGGRA